jgi:hypothetical protein
MQLRALQRDADGREGAAEHLGLLAQHLRVDLVQRLQHKVHERARHRRVVVRHRLGLRAHELARLRIKPEVAPEPLRELLVVHRGAGAGGAAWAEVAAVHLAGEEAANHVSVRPHRARTRVEQRRRTVQRRTNANDSREKHQPLMLDAKHTLPSSGDRRCGTRSATPAYSA